MTAALRRSVIALFITIAALALWVTPHSPQGAGRRPASSFSGNRPDSALVMGPNTYTSTSATAWTYYALTDTIPNFDPSNRYFFRITNGDTASGANRVSQVSILVNGKEVMNSSDVTTSVSAVQKVVWISSAITTFQFGVRGALDRYIKVKLYATPDPSYAIYGGSYSIDTDDGFAIFTDSFSKSSNASGPWTLVVDNGAPDGSNRCTNVRVTLNGTEVITSGLVGASTANVMRQVTLLANNNVTVRLYGGNGAQAGLTWTATDTMPPVVNVTRPLEGYVTDSASVATTVGLADQTPPMTVSMSGLSAFLASTGFTVAAPLATDGLYNFKVRVTDHAGYATEVARHVVRDTRAPDLWVNYPPPTAPTTTAASVTVSGVWSDSSITTVTVDGDVVGTPDSSGTFHDVTVPLDLGPNGILFRARDALGHTTEFKRYVYRLTSGEPTPRDSSQINLTQLPQTELSGFRERVRFLFYGTNPYQSGIDTTKLINDMEAVVRGRVLARDFGPLANVSVRVLNHPEYGESITREDGSYSLVVNGGAPVVLRFLKAGFLESQRRVDVPVRDYALIDDVALVGRSGLDYPVNNAAPQTIVGRFESDANGDRRLYMLVPQGIVATVTPSGSAPVTYSSFRVRLKEFTVGSNGDQSMPGSLPPTTAYTYCVGVSLVEADDILATQPFGTLAPDITFDPPIISYTREFLGVPVGTSIPSGVYDARTGRWLPREDGRVIRMLGATGGLANLDTNGDGVAETDSVYASLGISSTERTQLVPLFAPGDSLWRVPMNHFSSVDNNYNVAANASAASSAAARAGLASSIVDDPSCSFGCIIENENRVLGETIPLRGVPFSLHYRSSRQPGDRAMRWVRVPLVGASKPPGLTRVHLVIDVAGRRFRYAYDPASLSSPDVRYFRDWDGTDAFDRPVEGSVIATVRVGYEFPASYARGTSTSGSFGDASTIPVSGGGTPTGDRALNRIRWTTQQVSLGAPSMASAGLGGWTITPHHFYDRNGRGTVYFGDGSIRIATRNYPIIQIFAGNGQASRIFDLQTEGQPVTSVGVTPNDIAFKGDTLLFTDGGKGRVVRVAKDGIYHRVAGGGSGSPPTDGMAALDAALGTPKGLAVAPDGSIYFADATKYAVFKVTPSGLLYRVAGNLTQSSAPAANAEGILATDRTLAEPISVALGPDGSVFIGDSGLDRVFRVGTDGLIRTYAGTGASPGGEVTTEGKATAIPMHEAYDLDTDSEGNLFIAEYGNDRIRRVSPDGMMTTVGHVDGRASHIDVAPDGSLYVYVANKGSVVRIEPDGSLTMLAGGYGTGAPLGADGQNLGYAAAATLPPIGGGIALGSDGALYFGEQSTGLTEHYVRRILPDLPGAVAGEIAFPSEDGRQVFYFSERGRHLRTMDVTTGDTLYAFGYVGGRLSTITDANHDVTTILRDALGTPNKIVGPYNAENVLAFTNGYLTEVRNPATSPAETYAMTYENGPDAQGLLKTFTNPRSKTQTFTYKLGATDQDDGRLESDKDAANATQTFTLVDSGVVRRLTRTSPVGRVTEYEITEMLDGLRRRWIGRPDHSQVYSADSMNTNLSQPPLGERLIAVGPGGEQTITRPSRDSRFGMLAKIPAEVSTRLPSGLLRTVTTSRDYVTNGGLIETMALNGTTFTTTYDANSRTFTTLSPENRTSTVTLDVAGRPTSIQIGSLEPLALQYDDGGRGKLVKMEQGDRGWRYSYDGLGRLEVVSDSLHRKTRYTYDGGDRVVSKQLPGGQVVGYAYDANGNLTGLTPPGRPEHQFGYTPVDLNERYTPPSVPGIADPATRYEFDLDRQREKVTRPDGGVIDLVYEVGTGRLLSILHPRGINQYTYWDTPQQVGAAPTGQLKTVTSPDTVTVSYAYDGPLLTSETWSGAVAGSVEHLHDRAFRDSLERVVVGSAVDTAGFSYDRDGLLVRAGPMRIERRSSDGLVASTAVGVVTSSVGYDSHGDLADLHYTVNGNAYFHEHLERDVLGRIVRVDETWSGVTTSRTFEYDAAGRLEKVMDGAGVQIRRYEYDLGAPGNGNRSKEFGTGDVLLTSAAYDAQDRLLSYGDVSYGYTAAGERLVRRGPLDSVQTIYDALGNLVSVQFSSPINAPGPPFPAATQIRYLVDGQGRRVQKRLDGVAQGGWLYRDGVSILAELDGSGSLLHRYVHGTSENVPDLLMRAEVAYRLVTDHLGSVRAVVRATDGVVVERRDFDAWGVSTFASAPLFQSLGYAGGLTDAETGLIRFGARDYEPEVGRWTCKDPVGFKSRQPNLQSYVENRPVDSSDPSGLSVAAGVISGFGGDVLTPDPTDLCPQKWMVWATAIALAVTADLLPCKPCRTVTGKIVPVGTIGYRPLDTPDRPQHGVTGPHHNIYRANQHPITCRCFWQRLTAVSPGDLPVGAMPIEPFAN